MNLTDKELLQKTKELVREERLLTSKIIDHLCEIDKRKLFCDLGYGSIYDYCIYELGYSEDQSYRRIKAMRLASKEPLIKEKLDTGELTVTNTNLLSGLVKAIPNISLNLVVEKVQNKSKKECEQIINSIKEDNGIKIDKRINLKIKKETHDELKKIIGQFPGKDLDEVLMILAGKAREEKEIVVKRKTSSQSKVSRYIPKSVKAEVINRAGAECENCSSTYALEFDHIKPFSLGGTNHESNIRLLCRQCNQRAWIKTTQTQKVG